MKIDSIASTDKVEYYSYSIACFKSSYQLKIRNYSLYFPDSTEAGTGITVTSWGGPLYTQRVKRGP